MSERIRATILGKRMISATLLRIKAVCAHSLRRCFRAAQRAWVRCRAIAKAHGKKILYYGSIAAVLCAITYAAEQYRTEPEPEANALLLPAAQVQTPAPTETETEMVSPEGWEKLRGFSATPEWNAQLEQWEAHTAVDYRCPEGKVESLSAGTIRTVGESGLYGGFVEIESGEYLLRYASIVPDASIEPGMEIELGTLIGMADESMPGERTMSAHLHLEVERAENLEDYEALAAQRPTP